MRETGAGACFPPRHSLSSFLSKKYLSQKNVIEKMNASVMHGKVRLIQGPGAVFGPVQRFSTAAAVCQSVCQERQIKLLPASSSQHVTILECTCHIVSYLADVTSALSQSSSQGTSHLSVDGEERAIEVDSDWVEELAVEEEDSQAEDSVSGPEKRNRGHVCAELALVPQFLALGPGRGPKEAVGDPFQTSRTVFSRTSGAGDSDKTASQARFFFIKQLPASAF